MKKRIFVLLPLTILLTACIGQAGKVIFQPDPAQDMLQEQAILSETWQIIETQNGPGETGVPEWVSRYYKRELRELESSGNLYSDAYLFVGRSRGDNFSALQQWHNGFSVMHDFPRLVTQRVERRLIVFSALYPDDEYGEYFENLIKKVSDSDYPGAVREGTFWVKRKLIPTEENADDTEELPREEVERYEFLILISINKETLQKQLEEIMAEVKTNVPPTRDQTAAINKVRQSFFERF